MDTTQRSRLQATCWFAVVRAYQACTRRYAQLLRHFDLTIPQFDVLTAVHGLGDEATPKAIAERLVVTRGNITGLLQRLQDHGLLMTRRHRRDGRSFVCVLTPAGRRLFVRARTAAAAFIGAQMAPFDVSELRETEALMRRMRSHLEQIDPDALASVPAETPAVPGAATPGTVNS